MRGMAETLGVPTLVGRPAASTVPGPTLSAWDDASEGPGGNEGGQPMRRPQEPTRRPFRSGPSLSFVHSRICLPAIPLWPAPCSALSGD